MLARKHDDVLVVTAAVMGGEKKENEGWAKTKHAIPTVAKVDREGEGPWHSAVVPIAVVL